MFGKKKQTSIGDPFFARVEQSEIDLNDEVIQDLAEKSGVSESWPNVSLAGLQQFAAGLVNDVVRAGDHDVRIGNVVYFTTNEKGRAEPTGLSWERATLTAGFENIVVSTADHIFNDTEIRQDEDMTYDIIVEALQPLMDAVIADSTLSSDDLPDLPSEEQFRQARETGEVLAVEPNKLQRTTLEDKPPVIEADKAESREQPNDVTFTAGPDIPKIFEQLKQTSTGETVKPTVQAVVPDQNNSEGVITENDPTQKLIDRVNLAPNAFEISDVKADLPAEHPDYVVSRLNADKAKANDFLNDTSNIYTQKIRKAMADLLKQQQAKTKASVEQLRDTNVSETVDAQMKEERANEFETRYARAHQAREAGYRTAVEDENARHDNTLKTLKSDFVSDLEALKVSVNQELDNWFLERSKDLQSNLQATVNDQVSEVTSQAQTETLTSLKALRDDLLAQNTQSLRDMHQKLEEDISNKRAQYQSEHEQAMISATELESAKTHAGNLSELEQQVQILKQTNLTLEQQLKGKDAVNNDEVSQLRQQLQMLQNAPKTPSHDETNQQLMTLLAAQMKQPQVAQKKASGWQSAAIGVLAVLAIGGAGFGGYAMAQHKPDSTAQSSKTVSASSHTESNATVTLAPDSTSSIATSKVESSSSQSSSSSSQASSTSTLADRYHVGEDVDATINGQTVTAKVVSVQDKTITVHHDGYDYVVPFDN
ncbi:hypothetical protein QMA60_07300 [Leuconostoc suionicum]|uniref:hypothetical protein n=1 Tax=Leuconostoc suionicum TaxID=1511761 RepID=UPI0024ACB232|nr:hypothetical protein [Leuconostoc suionicum]MDI6498407.1 hypothetical protein [Leuconostoc suionicum]MDI6500449.1 hypothetical protein [Leuconostoc suionicum]MDI6502573.1 hypothetical protein [Leuconostoc suionicum]MDI6665425.1 hypothetical protein [Leuconostoc suionicum]